MQMLLSCARQLLTCQQRRKSPVTSRAWEKAIPADAVAAVAAGGGGGAG